MMVRWNINSLQRHIPLYLKQICSEHLTHQRAHMNTNYRRKLCFLWTGRLTFTSLSLFTVPAAPVKVPTCFLMLVLETAVASWTRRLGVGQRGRSGSRPCCSTSGCTGLPLGPACSWWRVDPDSSHLEHEQNQSPSLRRSIFIFIFPHTQDCAKSFRHPYFLYILPGKLEIGGAIYWNTSKQL